MSTLSATSSGAPAGSENTALTDGFHLVVDALKANDIDTIYGIVGIPITDLARVAQSSGMRYIGFRQETSAGNAAAAAGFLTRRPGVCLTTSGPGFLNGLPALANATTNCFPMIQISGSSNRALVDLQRGDYQDLDQLNAARPFVKAAYRVDRVEDIGRAVARAIRTAVSGRPGGVYLDIPGAVLGQAMDAAAGAESVWRVVDPAPRQLPAPEAVDRALDVLAQARRPLIVLGKGAAYAQADAVIRAVRRVHRDSVPADVDGQGAAARLAPAVRGSRALTGDRPRGRGATRRRTAELAARPWRFAAMVRRRQVHPSRHRGLGVRQQPADRGATGRRHRVGDRRAARRPDRPSGQGAGGVDRRAGRAPRTQRRQDA